MSKSVAEHILAKNLMILASAGSGKTYQLGNRVIGMISEKEAEPESRFDFYPQGRRGVYRFRIAKTGG